jgi:hypothetical protein
LWSFRWSMCATRLRSFLLSTFCNATQDQSLLLDWSYFLFC